MSYEIRFKDISHFSTKIQFIQFQEKKPEILWSKVIISKKKLDTPVYVYYSLNLLKNFSLENSYMSTEDFKRELQKAIETIYPKYYNKTFRMFLEDLQQNKIFDSIFYNSILRKSSLTHDSIS
jgi:hypothetical protein